MSIEYSQHAQKQIRSRKIPLKRVNETVRDPKQKIKSFKNRRLRQRRFGSKILEVVTITEGSKISIITAYYLKEKDEN